MVLCDTRPAGGEGEVWWLGPRCHGAGRSARAGGRWLCCVFDDDDVLAVTRYLAIIFFATER